MKFNLDDMELKTNEALIDNLSTKIEFAIDDIVSKDKNRCLFSLNKSKATDIKIPDFSGHKEEDFSKFRKESELGKRIK